MFLQICSINLLTPKPLKKPNPVDINNPIITLSHSEPFNPENPPWMAIAAPESPAIRACDWLVGIASFQAKIVHKEIPTNAPHNPKRLWLESVPKFTILKTVSATSELMKVIINKPKKLQIAAIINAFFGDKHLVETHVAIEFGATVHPFNKITPDISKVITIKLGLEISVDKKFKNVIFIS